MDRGHRGELAEVAALVTARRGGQQEEAGRDDPEEVRGAPQGDLAPASDQWVRRPSGGPLGRSGAARPVRGGAPRLGPVHTRVLSAGRGTTAIVVRLPAGLPLPGGVDGGGRAPRRT